MRVTAEQLQAEVGKKHGMLTVLRHKGKNRRGQNTFLCQCECGNYRVCHLAELHKGIVAGPRECHSCAKSRRAKHFYGLLKSAEADLLPLITRRGAK